MPASAAHATAGAGGSYTHIGNKHKRQDVYRKEKKAKAADKLKRRIARAKDEKAEGGSERKKARIQTNIPRTIENTRDPNPNIITAPNTHAGLGPTPEMQAALAASASAADAAGPSGTSGNANMQEEEEEEEDPHAPPALLITTSMPSNSTSPHLASGNARVKVAERVQDFVDELLNIFPGAEYRPRAKAKGAGIGKISGWARGRGYDALVVVGEDKKQPVSLTIVGLPNGPTAFFRLTSLSIGKEIYGHARPTPHTPELILNNFTTTLGHSVGTLLQSLFPRVPELAGRQVVTAHNQRDFVFFRRHRYMFKSTEKTALQEIGPRFTLKLRSLKEGLPKGAGVWSGVVAFDGEENEPVPQEEEGDEAQAAEEEAAAQEMQHDQNSGEAQAAPVAPPRRESAKEKRKREAKGAEEVKGLDFEWHPRMGVSRRNFYL